MSPRDALKRITSPFSTPQKGAFLRRSLSLSSEAASRLEALAADIEALPVEEKVSFVRTSPARSVGAATRWFALSDAVSLALGFVTAWLVSAALNSLFLGRDFPSLLGAEEVLRAAHYGVIGLGVMAWLWHKGHYNRRQPFWMEAQQIVKACAFAVMVDGFFQFAAKQDFSRLWLVSGWVFAAAFLLLFRFLVRRGLRVRGAWQIRTLLVGSGTMADEARAALRSESGLGYEIAMQIENLPLLLERAGGSWKTLCDRFNADHIVIALDGKALAEAEESLAQLSREGLSFSVSPPLRHLPVLGMEPQYFFNHDVMLMVPGSNLEQPLPRFLKRAFDVLASGFALLLLSPILLPVAFLVRRDGGPVFFGDLRIGRDGRAFYCLKFRSMVMNADAVLADYLRRNPDKQAEWDIYRKLRGEDPRVTRIGRFLRRWSVDELPQLINVFRGEMSLVGPRPIMFKERNVYGKDLAHYCRVRPGLTGVWQVSGRCEVSFAQRVQMDLWYIRNWSLWHDIAVLCKTLPAILKKTGAY